ncbi:MAG: riboflavin synthase [Actinomycetota bacterium]|nr:riboflavin synthase [Actinomycetota bacterium]
MFTGIVTEIGKVETVELLDGRMLFTFLAPRTVTDLETGDSIAVNGVCLTATSVTDRTFSCEAVTETLDRTNVGQFGEGTLVNLERPMQASGRFDGHVVQGHVDGVGTVRSVEAEGDAARIRIQIPFDLARYVVEKGSIAIDGTSLTVTAVSNPNEPDSWVEIVLIPHTIENTVLGSKSAQDNVNLEMDVFAKYIERMTEMNQ